MTIWQIVSALTANHDTAWITLPDGRTGILQSVQREDGSGHSFNLTVLFNDGTKRPRTETIYVRTTD